MAITVAPLTTTVLNSVGPHQTGVASGINNAVASVASLLVIAILGTVGIVTLDKALDRHLAAAQASAEVRQLVDADRRGFILPSPPANTPPEAATQAREIFRTSLLDAIRLVCAIGAVLAFASAACAALTIGGPQRDPAAGTVAPG